MKTQGAKINLQHSSETKTFKTASPHSDSVASTTTSAVARRLEKISRSSSNNCSVTGALPNAQHTTTTWTGSRRRQCPWYFGTPSIQNVQRSLQGVRFGQGATRGRRGPRHTAEELIGVRAIVPCTLLTMPGTFPIYRLAPPQAGSLRFLIWAVVHTCNSGSPVISHPHPQPGPLKTWRTHHLRQQRPRCSPTVPRSIGNRYQGALTRSSRVESLRACTTRSRQHTSSLAPLQFTRDLVKRNPAVKCHPSSSSKPMTMT